MQKLGFSLFTKMEIVFWYHTTTYQPFCNFFKSRRILISFTPSRTLYFKNCSLLKKDFLCSQVLGSNVRNRTEFSNKNELKRIVSEKKKYSKRGDGKSNHTENRSIELSENKLAEKNKTKKDELKRFRVNDVICDHDLQIKIDSMVKYIEKGKKVLCDVIAKREKNQLNEILKKLNDSKLKNYTIDIKITQKRLYVTYFQKVSNIEPDKEQEKENIRS